VAAVLSKRELPFVFLSGYDDAETFPPEFRQTPRLSKPVDYSAMIRVLATHFVTPRRMRAVVR